MSKIIYLVLALFSISVDAGSLSFSDANITKVYAGYDHKGAFFKVSTPETRNPGGCGAGIPDTFVADPATSNVDQVLSILLYAHASAKKVEVEFYDDKCFQNHRVLRKVAVY